MASVTSLLEGLPAAGGTAGFTEVGRGVAWKRSVNLTQSSAQRVVTFAAFLLGPAAGTGPSCFRLGGIPMSHGYVGITLADFGATALL